MSGAQSGFINQMVNYVLTHAPEVSKENLVLTGATAIRQAFPLEQQAVVIDGYMQGLHAAFAICIAATGVATLVGLGMRWKKLNPEGISSGGMA